MKANPASWSRSSVAHSGQESVSGLGCIVIERGVTRESTQGPNWSAATSRNLDTYTVTGSPCATKTISFTARRSLVRPRSILSPFRRQDFHAGPPGSTLVTTPSLSATNPRVPRGYQRFNGPGPGSRSGGTSRSVSGAMTSTAYPTTASRSIFRRVDHARKLLVADPVIGGAIGTGGLACSHRWRELSWSAKDGQERASDQNSG